MSEVVNFRERWRKLSWNERSFIEGTRARVYQTLGMIENAYDKLQEARAKHAPSRYWKKQLIESMERLENLEFEMQKLLGLKEDKNYHTYWMMPKQCTCPKMDNWDRLGHGRVISGDCPLHGKGMH